jgi:hypothetical protein
MDNSAAPISRKRRRFLKNVHSLPKTPIIFHSLYLVHNAPAAQALATADKSTSLKALK